MTSLRLVAGEEVLGLRPEPSCPHSLFSGGRTGPEGWVDSVGGGGGGRVVMLGDGERSGNDCVLTVCLYLMSSLPNFEAEMGVLTFGRIQSEASAVPVTCPMSHEYPVAEMRSVANLSGLEPPAFCSVSLHSLPKASGGSASVNSVPLLQSFHWPKGR